MGGAFLYPNSMIKDIMSITLGCDPELFIRNNKGVVASEAIISGDGVEVEGKTTTTSGYNRIVRDGVQVELHPLPTSCRANIGKNIARCMRKLKEEEIKEWNTQDKFRFNQIHARFVTMERMWARTLKQIALGGGSTVHTSTPRQGESFSRGGR